MARGWSAKVYAEAVRLRRARQGVFLGSKVELSVLEAEPGVFRLESGVVPGVEADDVVALLDGSVLDDDFGARDAPGGVVVFSYDAFGSRAAAEAAARIWRTEFVEGSEA